LSDPATYEEEIRFFLRVLAPDLEGLRAIYRRYYQRASPEQLTELTHAYLEKLEQQIARTPGKDAAPLWREASTIAGRIGDKSYAAAALRRAVEIEPNHFETRFALVKRLIENDDLAAAEAELTWCAHRRPGSKMLEEKLRDLKLKLGAKQRTAAVPDGLMWR
jgi:hypothetical protein